MAYQTQHYATNPGSYDSDHDHSSDASVELDRHITPATEHEYPPSGSEAVQFAHELDTIARQIVEDPAQEAELKQYRDLKNGRKSLAQWGDPSAYVMETLKRVDETLQMFGDVPMEDVTTEKGKQEDEEGAMEVEQAEEDAIEVEQAEQVFQESGRSRKGTKSHAQKGAKRKQPRASSTLVSTLNAEELSGMSADEKIAMLSAKVAEAHGMYDKLAASLDQSPKPYARRKAAMLRRGRSDIAASVEKLSAKGDKRSAKGRNGESELKATGVDYAATAELLHERDYSTVTRGQEQLVDNANRSVPDADTVATLVAELPDVLLPAQADAIAALFNLERSPELGEPALDAQDAFLSSHLVCALVKLLLANHDVINLAQLVVDLCGEAVWTDRLVKYLEQPLPELEVGITASFLGDAVAEIQRFDEKAAGALQDIVRTIP